VKSPTLDPNPFGTSPPAKASEERFLNVRRASDTSATSSSQFTPRPVSDVGAASRRTRGVRNSETKRRNEKLPQSGAVPDPISISPAIADVKHLIVISPYHAHVLLRSPRRNFDSQKSV
jgi:hypothetical protein